MFDFLNHGIGSPCCAARTRDHTTADTFRTCIVGKIFGILKV